MLGAQGLIGLPSSKSPESTLYLGHDGIWRHERPRGLRSEVGNQTGQRRSATAVHPEYEYSLSSHSCLR